MKGKRERLLAYARLDLNEIYDLVAGELKKEYRATSRQDLEKKLKEATMFTDWFSETCFRENYDLVKLILRIALKREFTIISVETQKFVGNDFKKKEVRFDVLAKDDEGNFHIIEIQNDADEMSFERLEFYNALFHSKLLASGEEYESSPKRTIILISREDIFHLGVCFSRARMCWEDGRPCEGSGLTVCYFNAECADNSPAGLLMKDWENDSSDGMCYTEVRQPVHFYKTEKGGKKKMFQAFEDYAKKREEYVWQQAEEAFKKELKKMEANYKRRERAMKKSVREDGIRALVFETDFSDQRIARIYGVDASYVHSIRQSGQA